MVVKQKPGLRNIEPFKTVLSGDREAIAKFTRKDLTEILAATLTRNDGGGIRCRCEALVGDGQASALESTVHRTYLIPAEWRKVLKYFRANGFKTYIVTGGGQDFVAVCMPNR